MDEVKLLPCPLCGDKDDYNPSVSTTYKYANPGTASTDLVESGHMIECDKCGCCGPIAPVEEEAARLWNTRPPIGTDEVVGPSLGAIPGSHPTDQAASHLGASRFDPERDERLCQCFADDEEDRPLTLRQLPGGNYIMLCDECGQRVIDDDPKTWRKLAEAAIMDLRHYADDELPHRRLVSARAYESRFNLLASVDTLPKGQDAQQGLAGTEGSAVANGETPTPGMPTIDQDGGEG